MSLDTEKAAIEGRVCLYGGKYEEAFLYFSKAGSPRNFIYLARAALEKGNTSVAVQSFKLAGIQLSKKEDGIIKGDLSFAIGNFVESFWHYKNAGARLRLLNLGFHSLKQGYVPLALDCYKEAREKPPEKELRHFIDSYVENIDQRIKERSHIGIKEACLALGDKNKLKSIADLLIEKGKIIFGIYFYEDTGEKFPKDLLTPIQKARLIAEGDRCYRDGIRIGYCPYGDCIKAYAVAGAKDRLASLFDRCLYEEELEYALEILKALYGVPLERNIPCEMADKIFSYAKVCFQKGEFCEAMKACHAIGRKPPKEELYLCGEGCFFAPDEKKLLMLSPEVFREGLKAYKKAGLPPSKKKIIAAGYNFLSLGFYYYARQAFEEALSIKHLQNFIKFFEENSKKLLEEKENPQILEKWISEIDKKDLDESTKNELIKLRRSSFNSRIRFNNKEISEAREAQKRVGKMISNK